MLPRSHTKWSVGFLFFQVATQTLKHVRNIWLALIYSLIASVFLCDSRLAVNTPCEVCGFDHNKTWKSSECSLEKQARTLKGKKLSWLQISLFLVVIAYLKKNPDGLMAMNMMVHCQGYLDSGCAMIHCVVFSIPFRQYDMLFYTLVLDVVLHASESRHLQEAIHQRVRIFTLAHRTRKAAVEMRTPVTHAEDWIMILI